MKTQIITDADTLFKTLEGLFGWAEQIDMSYAWASSAQTQGRHWKALPLSKVRRAVIGTAFAQTEPRALELLDKKKDRLRLMINSEGTFHPKVILGRKGERAKALVGSANFTSAAYTSNTEISVLLNGGMRDKELGDIQSFIDAQWTRGVAMTKAWLGDYKRVWDLARRRKIVIPGAKLEITSISSLDMSWDTYVRTIEGQHGRALADGNKVWVFNGHPSYFHEIDESARIFRRTSAFAAISKEDRQFLMGMGRSSGFIGTMRAAGYAKEIVNEAPEKIGAALDRIPLTGPISNSLAEEVLNQMSGLKGVKVGVASRLLAVKRPDVFVSVNNGSKPQLARLIGGKQVDSVKKYLALLELIWATDWYSSARPEAKREASIWERRAALLDAALYEQV